MRICILRPEIFVKNILFKDKNSVQYEDISFIINYLPWPNRDIVMVELPVSVTSLAERRIR